MLGPRGAGHAHKYYRPQDVQSLQIWEERANTAIMVLYSNIDVMQSMADFYRRLLANRDFDLARPCSDDIDAFVAQINDIIHDFRTQMGRATDLVKATNNRKELVGFPCTRTYELRTNELGPRLFNIYRASLPSAWRYSTATWRRRPLL